MKKKTQVLATEEDLLLDLTFHGVPVSLLSEFVEKIVKPYYKGNMTAAVRDLLQKNLADQDFIQFHIRSGEV
jgi:tagatose-1,6-bisphosphate aldolase non-catalytic subunit AgaZ/GatZ